MNSLACFSHVVFSFAATYWLHSTVLLATCWIVTTGLRVKSHFLVERLWKLAAVLGLLTAVLQISTGVSPVIELAQWVSTDTTSERVLVELTEQTSEAAPVSFTESQQSMGLSG